MSKLNFEKYILKNINNVKNVYCRVWKGQGEIPGKTASWLDVYINGAEYKTIFCSDYFEEDSKDILKLQKQWVKKLKNWINPNWELNLIIDEQYI